MASDEYLIGLAGLSRLLESGVDLTVLGPRLQARIENNPFDAITMLDLSTLLFITRHPGNRLFAFEYQRRALQMRQVYRLAPQPDESGLRLLVLMAAGDLKSNTPVDFLLEGSEIALTLLFVLPDRPLPSPLPEHDVIFVAIGESSENQKLLRQLNDLVQRTQKPIINAPDRIARVGRNQSARLLERIAGAVMPATVRVGRRELSGAAQNERAIMEILEGGRFPLIVRPIDSHGGKGLEKIDSANDLLAYLRRLPDDHFYISNFVDYRSADGQFKKLRVVLVDGKPFASHMGISSHWMIHYVNANMDESADKRQEEERFFVTFDRDFAARHRESLAIIAERMGLDYLTIDCAELPDGTLLIFEVDNAGVVHALDDPKIFPYKRPAMEKLFSAFRAMLIARAASAARGSHN